jgi:PKD repeat protein
MKRLKEKIMKKLTIVSLCALVLVLISGNAFAEKEFVAIWQGIYPNSLSDDNADGCQLCHGTRNSNFNEYGWDVRIQLQNNTDIGTAITSVVGVDSDMDGTASSNKDEIDADTQPGWTEGPNNTIYDKNGTALKGQLPPTGIVGSLDPLEGNQPPVAQANGPYSGTVDVPISFTSAGSYDPENTPVSYSWAFGDGSTSTSTEQNPSHTYTAPGTYNVSLTVTDADGASNIDTTEATVTVPPVNEPDINLTSRAIVVENTGTTTLQVTEITLCVGTSDEYTWSPDVLSIDPNASQTLTVLYDPIDGESDVGCLMINSNDPDEAENPAILQLSGSGFIPQPDVLDLDIAGFRVTKRVSGKRVKPIAIKLVVKGDTTITGSVNATESVSVTVTGTQNGVEVYSETISDLSSTGRTTVSLPAYTPEATGNINWTVTLIDADPDIDEATATTKVVP